MISKPFLNFDPFLSFSRQSSGRKERRFYNHKGEPAYKDLPQKGESSSLWQTGSDVYDELANHLSHEPTTDELLALVRELVQLEDEIASDIQRRIDSGLIDLVLNGGPEPIQDFKSPAQNALLGWVTEVYVNLQKAAGPNTTAGEEPPDFGPALAVAALVQIDNCILCHQLDVNFDKALSDLHSFLNAASSMRERLRTTRETLKKNAAKGAAVKLAQDPKQQAKDRIKKLWEAWQAGRELHKSGAAFCRHAVKVEPKIESVETVARWTVQWRKERKKH